MIAGNCAVDSSVLEGTPLIDNRSDVFGGG